MSIRVLVIGFGFMGQTHAGNILKRPGTVLSGIVDPYSPYDRLTTIKGNKATVSIVPDDVKEIPHYTTMLEGLTKSDADVCIIALPTKLHYSGVMEVFAHHKHVFVEKPFSISLEECAEMNAASEREGKLLCVGYVVRCMREYRAIRHAIQSGEYGKLKFLSLTRITGMPAWGNWADPEFIMASGGALYDLVSHDIDFTRSCLGEPDKIVADPVISREFNGNMISAVMHYGQMHVFVHGGFVSPSPFPFRRNATAYFERGTLITDAPGDFKIVTPDGVRQMDYSDDNPYYTELDEFLSAVESNRSDGFCSGADAVHSIQCCRTIADQLH